MLDDGFRVRESGCGGYVVQRRVGGERRSRWISQEPLIDCSERHGGREIRQRGIRVGSIG
ncbi:hypothetical protein I7I50_00659 [Histoplasma capsulatum G186AR]|uniref:Uncharacterized protein n=1 Tax=Ajellomyces capsulatus TaxID=5037 RepID=A0A8H7YG07_AJECA|nr:hypothetical protein I7I52_07927 [Histoplasma capsulatum]QSS72725.1 hypothetical protein I7I50_00659 [Histoplasma capsulatum G186AR]